MKQNKKCGPGCNCIPVQIFVTAHRHGEDVHELEIEELAQESQVMHDDASMIVMTT